MFFIIYFIIIIYVFYYLFIIIIFYFFIDNESVTVIIVCVFREQIQNDIVDILMAFTQPSLAKEESEEGTSAYLLTYCNQSVMISYDNTRKTLLLPPTNMAWYCVWSCLSVCPVCALVSESLDLLTSFMMWRYIFRIYRSRSYIKVIRSRSRSQEQKKVIRE